MCFCSNQTCQASIKCNQCLQNYHLTCLKSKVPFFQWKSENKWLCYSCEYGRLNSGTDQISKAADDVLLRGIPLHQASSNNKIEVDKLSNLIRWQNLKEHSYHLPNEKKCSVQEQNLLSNVANGKKRTLYDEKVLKWAVNYAQKNNVGCRKAARASELHFRMPTNSVPHSTVYRYINQFSKFGTKCGPKPKLTSFEESLITQHVIMQLQQRQNRMTRSDLVTEIMKIVCREGRPNPFQHSINQKPSDSFIRSFLNRHSEIKIHR